MRTIILLFTATLLLLACSRQTTAISGNDRKKDIQIVTTEGTIVLRLSDSTPLHQDNFLRLVKARFYDSILFHRVIKGFMIQAGDPASKQAPAGVLLGTGGLNYTVPAEINPALFHKRGALGAARKGDTENPLRASSSTQFYIVQGKTFTDAQLDSVEVARLQGRKISPERRTIYKTIGGTPQLDGTYTVFGEVFSGMEVVDKIAAGETSKGRDRPLQDVRIITVTFIRRR
jgi:peptidyl-prolyl cis-trans isomerase B (cyclophilin B)